MLFEELKQKELIVELENKKYLCRLCNKQYTKGGVATHYHYQHTEEGRKTKKNISTKIKGKSRKNLTLRKRNQELKKLEEEQLYVPQKEHLNRQKIKKFLKNKYGDNDLAMVGRWIKRKYSNVYNSIIQETKYLKSDSSIPERIYNIINNINKITTCKCCNNFVNFNTFYSGYYTYCHIKCASRDEDIHQKKKETCLIKYGVEHHTRTQECKDKTIQTNLEKYGVEHPYQSKEIQDKTKQTWIKKYGVDSPMKVKEIQIKCRKSLDDHYIEDPDFKEYVQNKTKATNNKKFGSDHFMKTDHGVIVVKESVQKKYGVDCYFQSEKFLNKQRDDSLKKLNKVLEYLNYELVDENLIDFNYDHKWKCLTCNNEFVSRAYYFQQGFGRCPICFPRNIGTSIAEKEIVSFIKEILPTVNIIENDTTIVKSQHSDRYLELDIYIPDKKIAIEYDGSYYHSEARQSDKNYHLYKTQECEKQGIQLIHIFEDEWIYKQDIVKDRLKQILGVNTSKRIHARKCIIKEIKSKVKNDFIEKYHIQGKDSSTIKIGAFYADELVSVMTFGKGSIAKGSTAIDKVWELNRFCSNSNYHIPGIASKLLVYFKRNYEWEEIFSYADRRWSQGNLYYKLEFKLTGKTRVNYWYLKGIKRHHRFGLRKRPDEPKDIPEQLLRQQEGYIRIWDCGSLKFNITNNVRNNK